MEYSNDDIQRLKQAVEFAVGRKICTPKDYDFLEQQVVGFTEETLSASTLKRVWGYVASKSNISHYSLDVLSRVVGFENWDDFSNENNVSKDYNSQRVIRRKLFTKALSVGDTIKVTWKPDRVITIEYIGQERFRILESINSKLKAGDTFCCLMFVDNEHLFLHKLARDEMPVSDYICGQEGGIRWNLTK